MNLSKSGTRCLLHLQRPQHLRTIRPVLSQRQQSTCLLALQSWLQIPVLRSFGLPSSCHPLLGNCQTHHVEPIALGVHTPVDLYKSPAFDRTTHSAPRHYLMHRSIDARHRLHATGTKPYKDMNALVIEDRDGSPALVQKKVPLPPIAPSQVLVKVEAVAQNPTDVQAFDKQIFGDGAVLGCDFAGTVVELGSDVTRLQKGDTIAGVIWGGEINGIGAYSEYTVAHERICFKVPKGITLPQAATIPLASITAWLALFSKDSLGIDRSSGSSTSLLVWGGSSSVGQYAVQIAKLHGFKVVATCSPQQSEHVCSLGADFTFDYRDPDVVQKIKDAVPDIKYVFDTIGNETSSVLGSRTIHESGGTLCTVRPGKVFTENVAKNTKVKDVILWTCFYRDLWYKDNYYPPSEADHELAAKFCDRLPALIEEGKIKPNAVKILPGWLSAVETGFQEHRDGKISATKLVYEYERPSST